MSEIEAVGQEAAPTGPAPAPRDRTTLDDWGKLILRLSVGGLMLFHGIAKLGSGVEGIEGMLEAHQLPTEMAYGVYVGELVAPVLLILGLFTRTAGLIVAFNMLVAVHLAHMADLTKLSDHGGWAVELQAFYLLGGLALVFFGGGRLALRGRR